MLTCKRDPVHVPHLRSPHSTLSESHPRRAALVARLYHISMHYQCKARFSVLSPPFIAETSIHINSITIAPTGTVTQ